MTRHDECMCILLQICRQVQKYRNSKYRIKRLWKCLFVFFPFKYLKTRIIENASLKLERIERY